MPRILCQTRCFVKHPRHCTCVVPSFCAFYSAYFYSQTKQSNMIQQCVVIFFITVPFVHLLIPYTSVNIYKEQTYILSSFLGVGANMYVFYW